ncbi:prephenate dehydrogenase [Spirochaetia bacterium]|nr:prephenate dehydrogenase [Spirochaetia bacterium]
MKPIEECVVGIVGLGLMGGAIAMALRNCGALTKNSNTAIGSGNSITACGAASGAASSGAGGGRILACDIDGETLAAALTENVIDEGLPSPENMLGRCDLVFLCLNPSTLLRFMDTWMAHFKPGALITDIAGIKGKIVDAVERVLRPDLDFIPGHPMAGAEKGSFGSAKNVSFHGKNYILTPLKRNRPENLDYLKALIYRMGFGRIMETTAAEHDRKIAFTSQLCHVIAAALIDCESDTAITRFGGGSFEDLTRIAMLNAPMWTELFLENRRELLSRIEQFEKSLDKLKNYITNGDEAALQENLRQVRKRRAAMNG